MNLKVNQGKLLFRAALVIPTLGACLFLRDQTVGLALREIAWGIAPIHILWGLLVIEMVIVPFPALNSFVSCGKLFKRHYIPNPSTPIREKLVKYNQQMNRAAGIVLIIWLACIIVLGVLIHTGTIGHVEIVMTTLALYLGDQICVNLWCPLQTLIMGNKCCNTCRIYNWWHLMVFSPLVYFLNPYTAVLLGISLFILLQWEFMHLRHPERFSEITNLSLRCSCCRDKICFMKRKLKAGIPWPASPPEASPERQSGHKMKA